MKQKTKYRTLKPMDSVCAGDALYVDGILGGRFRKSAHTPAMCFVGVLARISDQKVEVRRKHKQRNKTKAKWL